MERRQFLISAVASAASVGLPGCGGSGGESGIAGGVGSEVGGSADRASCTVHDAIDWNFAQLLLFLAGSPASTDLSATLPPEVCRGGVFGLAANSSPLPPQLTLTPGGILYSAGPPVDVSNVVFSYQEP